MRLLERNNAGEIRLTEVPLGGNAPPYAILSHTWGTEEVSFKDLMDGTGKNKLGYDKIRFCGVQAWRDGLQHFWVDTCCINKPSSSELQESINSMFRWYRGADKCYVYLEDVSRYVCDADGKRRKLAWEWAFRKSKWFTRGWTLQELIAPVSVRFFSKEGVLLGDRASLKQDIHHITGIPLLAIQGCPLSDFSVAERLAWIAKRDTTRKEDKVYSLLGIFDIHMPLICGEGEKNAFRRLREGINKAAKGELPPIPAVNDTEVSWLRKAAEEAQADRKRAALLDWLCNVDHSEIYNVARDKHEKGTSDWLIKDSVGFNTWERSPGSRGFTGRPALVKRF